MTIQVHVNGQVFDGFERGALQLTMDEPVNSFDVEYVADGKQPGARVIFEGDEVSISLDDGNGAEEVIAGYVDTVDDADEEELIRLNANGRSKAADLVDCSATHDPGSWTNATIDKIASDICAPFGVSCFVESDPGKPFPNFSVHKGETAYEAISRAAILRGLYAYSVGGDLVIASAGTTQTATVLARGDGRLLRSARTNSWHQRFSEYRFLGQVRSTDNNFGKNAAHLKGVVEDPTVGRFRPLSIRAGGHSGIDMETRARLERNRRAGRSERITALVDGWLADEGQVWRPNTLVKFSNPVLGVDATLIITTARFRFGATEPRQTELYMTRPEAYDVGEYPHLARSDEWT